MLKKFLYFIFSILIIFFTLNICNPIYSNATTTATVYLQSNINVLEKGEEVEISFNIKDQNVAAYNTNIYFDNTKFDYISGPENININGDRIIIVWYDTQGGNAAKQGELGKIKFKAKEEGIANFVIDGQFFSSKGQLIQTNFKSLQVQVGKEETNLERQSEGEKGTNTQSSNANLQALRVNQEGIVPVFDTNIYVYDLTVKNNINDIEVLAISENSNAKIEITGNTGLKEGLNTIKIKVISEDQTQNKTYTINVTKTANLELANTNLEILAIENALLTPPFDNNVTQYNTEVSNEVTQLNILAVPENESGKVVIAGNQDIKEGNNTVIVTVTAPNGFTKREYKINVYKRNQQEEEKYKEEQKELQEKIEEAYEIEKTSIEDTEDTSSNEELTKQEKTKRYLIIGIIVAIVIVCIVIGIIYYKKRRK